MKIVLTCVPKLTLILDEKNWLDAFWTYLLGQSDWSCTLVNDLFFTCDQNRLQSIYDGIAGDEHWDFIGMTGELNGGMKGAVRNLAMFSSRFTILIYNPQIGGKYEERVIAKSENLRRKIVRPQVPWPRSRVRIRDELDLLGVLAQGCSIWSSDYVFGPLDNTNNRIYNAMYVIQMFSVVISLITGFHLQAHH